MKIIKLNSNQAAERRRVTKNGKDTVITIINVQGEKKGKKISQRIMNTFPLASYDYHI
jgi:hypothetical protein